MKALEESPYRPKLRTLGKYGPSLVRDIIYVNKGSSDRPFVSVKQRKNGQYVVVEKLPAKNFMARKKFATVEQSLADTGVNFRSLKPSWKYSAKNPYVPTAGHYQPQTAQTTRSLPPLELPPIDLGWKKEARTDSLSNVEHQPGGGDKPILNEKLRWKARAKIGSLDNIDFNRVRTSRSDPNPTTDKMEFSTRFGALANIGNAGNAHYTPGGAKVMKRTKLYDGIGAKVGSLDNVSHSPRGGDVSIPSQRLRWKRESRVGSLDNVHHQPQGGDIFILDQRLTWQAKPKVGSLDNVCHHPRTPVQRIVHHRTDWSEKPRVGSLDNIHHVPGGGNVMIQNRRLRWKAEAKVNSLPTRHESYEDLSSTSDYL